MRKGVLAVGAVIVLGGGYLAAQAYSSQVFERELVQMLSDLEARGDLHVERHGVERGWFVSHGELHLSPTFGEEWRLEVPYTARHGLLTTRSEGEVGLAVGEADEQVFGDVLPSARPRWSAAYQTLSGEMEARLDMAAFATEMDGVGFDFQGGDALVSGQRGDLSLQARIDSWQVVEGDQAMSVGPMNLESRYRYSDGGRLLHQQDDLLMTSITVRQRYGPVIEMENIGYRGDVRLGEDELDFDIVLSLGDVQAEGQSVLAGEMAFGLSRLNADAARDLVETLNRELASTGSTLDDLDAAQRDELFAKMEPLLLALLSDSPRLEVSSLRLDSGMLDMKVNIDGELTFDGEGVEGLSLYDPAIVDGFEAFGFTELQRRLDGRFTWHGLPAMAAMSLGLPLSTRDLKVEIDAGEVTVNGEPLSSIW